MSFYFKICIYQINFSVKMWYSLHAFTMCIFFLKFNWWIYGSLSRWRFQNPFFKFRIYNRFYLRSLNYAEFWFWKFSCVIKVDNYYLNCSKKEEGYFRVILSAMQLNVKKKIKAQRKIYKWKIVSLLNKIYILNIYSYKIGIFLINIS